MSVDIEKVLQGDSSLYLIQKNDIDRCAKLMARAFDNDPSIRYLLGGNDEGKKDWKYFYSLLKALYGKGIMLSKDKEINELVLLLPPTLKGVPSAAFMLNGGAILPFLFKSGLLLRSLRYETNCQKVKSRFITSNTWYCMALVVEPKMQNQGHGSALMKDIFKTFDAMNYQIYLETHKPVNVEIYKHFGFELKDISVIPGTNISQYAMFREPQK